MAHVARLYSRLAYPSHSRFVKDVLLRQVIHVGIGKPRQAGEKEHIPRHFFIALQFIFSQGCDKTYLLPCDVTWSTHFPTNGMVDEGIGVNDVPFMQVFEQGSQHGEIASRSVELESLFFGEVVLQVFDKGDVGFLHGNILHTVAIPDEVCQILVKEQQAF